MAQNQETANNGDDSIRRALASPACLHVALLMTAIKYTWDTGSMDRIKKSFLHHKLEAIKFVNEQLQNPGMAATDCTIASIAALALAEVGARRRPWANMAYHFLRFGLAMG